MIDDLTIQRVKEAADIVAIVSDFVALRKAGSGYTCICPFHDDHNDGNFMLSPRRNMYKCFTCEEKGDAISYLMKAQKMKFDEAVHYIAQKHGIFLEDSKKYNFDGLKKSPAHLPAPPLDMLVIDLDKYVKPTLGKENTLTTWLRALPWNEEQRQRLESNLKNYMVGTAKNGRTIFWQVDERLRVRTGKMIPYKTDGHRCKKNECRGPEVLFTHNSLFHAGLYDSEKFDYKQCLYGMHLLNLVAVEAKAWPKNVHIVESEKTAIICSTVFGNISEHLWMSCGSISNMKRSWLTCLIDCNIPIVLHPDRDGIDKWKAKAKDIGYKHLTIDTAYVTPPLWKPEDGDKADIADVLIRMLQEDAKAAGTSVLNRPEITELINKLDLELINDGRQQNQ